ncbi:hypothetical protein DV515_00006821, partial [Chloebia gouldiae]
PPAPRCRQPGAPAASGGRAAAPPRIPRAAGGGAARAAPAPSRGGAGAPPAAAPRGGAGGERAAEVHLLQPFPALCAAGAEHPPRSIPRRRAPHPRSADLAGELNICSHDDSRHPRGCLVQRGLAGGAAPARPAAMHRASSLLHHVPG